MRNLSGMKVRLEETATGQYYSIATFRGLCNVIFLLIFHRTNVLRVHLTFYDGKLKTVRLAPQN